MNELATVWNLLIGIVAQILYTASLHANLVIIGLGIAFGWKTYKNMRRR